MGIAEILLTVYLMTRKEIVFPIRLLFCLILLFVLYSINNDYDRRAVRTFSTGDLPPGSFISYSYNQIIDQEMGPLIGLRLLGERYLHFGLVVDNNGRRDVLEWRQKSIEEFRDYIVTETYIGFIYSIPIKIYLQEMSKMNITLAVFYPPVEQYVPLDISYIDSIKDKFLYCTRFSFLYATKVMGLDTSPFLYFPSQCAKELRRNGWREEYYILQ